MEIANVGEILGDFIVPGTTQQGYVYKSYSAFYSRKGICYVPEHGLEDDGKGIYSIKKSTTYTYDDIVAACQGNRVLAQAVFDAIDWQHPESYLFEMEEDEINEICDYTAVLEPSKALPPGWFWHRFNDGSGSLYSPELTKYFSYDQSENTYISPITNDKETFVEFAEFTDESEQWIKDHILKKSIDNHQLNKWLSVWHEVFDPQKVLESVYTYHRGPTLSEELNDEVCSFLDSIGSIGEDGVYIDGFDKNGLCETDVVAFYNDAWDRIYEAVNQEFSIPTDNSRRDSTIDWDEVGRVFDHGLVEELHINTQKETSLESEAIDAQKAAISLTNNLNEHRKEEVR